MCLCVTDLTTVFVLFKAPWHLHHLQAMKEIFVSGGA